VPKRGHGFWHRPARTTPGAASRPDPQKGQQAGSRDNMCEVDPNRIAKMTESAPMKTQTARQRFSDSYQLPAGTRTVHPGNPIRGGVAIDGVREPLPRRAD
jgi:hypothetical protein